MGTGILVSAIKNEIEDAHMYEKSLIHWASQLNKGASQVIRDCGVRACTDITGFGLAGHALEMAKASHKAIVLEGAMLPSIDGVNLLLKQGFITGGGQRNKEFIQKDCFIAEYIDPLCVELVFDPQTSGGALLAVNEKNIKKALNILAENGDMGYIVGYVEEKTENNLFLSIL